MTIVFAKNVKELETLILTIRICSQDIGMEFRIEKYAMLIIKEMEKEKQQITHRENLRTLGEKKKLQISGNIKSRHPQKDGNKRKEKQERIQKNKETSGNQTLPQKKK